jgi:hypothetical protein
MLVPAESACVTYAQRAVDTTRSESMKQPPSRLAFEG